MNLSAKNYLKGNYLTKKECKVGLFLFSSTQKQLPQSLFHCILQLNNQSSRNVLFYDFSSRTKWDPNQKNFCDIREEISQDKALTIKPVSRTVKSVMILQGMECFLNYSTMGPKETLEKVLDNYQEQTKQIFIFLFQDQLMSPTNLDSLIKCSHFVFDFSTKPKDQFTFISFSEYRVPQTQSLKFSIVPGDIKIEVYVDQNTVIEKKNPDQLIQSTFKLGVNEQDQENKSRLVLPHFKDKQIEEMKERAQKEEEEDKGEFDEEQEDLEEELG